MIFNILFFIFLLFYTFLRQVIIDFIPFFKNISGFEEFIYT